jgi:hypothetical protein
MDVCRECCVLSGRGLCDGLITHPESCRLWCVVVCDLETSWMRGPWPAGGCRARKTNMPTNIHIYNTGTCIIIIIIIIIINALVYVSWYSDLLRMEVPGIESLRMRDFPHQCRPAVWPTQPPIHWVLVLSRGVKRAGRGVDHPYPSTAEVKVRIELYFKSPFGPSGLYLGWTLPLLSYTFRRLLLHLQEEVYRMLPTMLHFVIT